MGSRSPSPFFCLRRGRERERDLEEIGGGWVLARRAEKTSGWEGGTMKEGGREEREERKRPVFFCEFPALFRALLAVMLARSRT